MHQPLSQSYLSSNKRLMVLQLCAHISQTKPKFSYQDLMIEQTRSQWQRLYRTELSPRQMSRMMSTAPYLREIGQWYSSAEYEFIEDYRSYASMVPPLCRTRMSGRDRTGKYRRIELSDSYNSDRR